MSNLKKVLIICGQTGVGKTDTAVRLAKRLNSEIIVLDNMQQYKQINICNNKPLQYLNTIKFHNVDIADINSPGNNATQFAIRSKSIIKDLCSQGKIPVLEGGSGFYTKSLLTGNSIERTETEQAEYDKATQIARDIINYDKDFKTTLKRLNKLDSTIPQFTIQENDNYRLEKRLTDAILYGDGAFRTIKQKEEERKFQTIGEFEYFNFFLYMDKIPLFKSLEERCEKMIKNGLVKEIAELIKDGYLTGEKFSEKGSIYTHAYGVEETINFLKALLQKYNNKESYLQAYSPRASPRDLSLANYRRDAEKLIYNYLSEFVIKNRQYAKRQAAWFRSHDNFVWKKVTNKDTLSEEIFNLLCDRESYNKELANSNNAKQDINRSKEPKYLPNFSILKDKKQIHDFLRLSYSELEPIKDKIISFELNLTKPGERDINIELIKKYLI
jgi:tRNA dimethylallyltransferase